MVGASPQYLLGLVGFGLIDRSLSLGVESSSVFALASATFNVSGYFVSTVSDLPDDIPSLVSVAVFVMYNLSLLLSPTLWCFESCVVLSLKFWYKFLYPVWQSAEDTTF